MKKSWLLGLAGLLVVIVIVIVVAITTSGSDSTAADSDSNDPRAAETQPAQITGAPLPLFADQGDADPAIGMMAPTVDGRSFDGSALAIRSGSPTLLVFFAHWCHVCQAEMPVLTTWATDGGVPAGLDVVGIATSTSKNRPNYPPSAWFGREHFPFPVMADTDDSAIAANFGLPAYPFYVLVDADGEVVRRESGQLDAAGLSRLAELAATAS